MTAEQDIIQWVTFQLDLLAETCDCAGARQ
jgi:hypothetical protein